MAERARLSSDGRVGGRGARGAAGGEGGSDQRSSEPLPPPAEGERRRGGLVVERGGWGRIQPVTLAAGRGRGSLTRGFFLAVPCP